MNGIQYDDISIPAAEPIEGVQPTANPFDAIAEQVIGAPVKVRVIDYMRPDWARAAGVEAHNRRRAGLTAWRPTERYNRKPHQGEREMARRVKQMSQGRA